MLRLKLEVKGLDEAMKKMENRRALINDMMKESLRDVGEWYINFLQNDVWETEGAVIGESWSSLNPQYAESKAGQYPGRGILERTGKLRTSWRLYTTSQYARIENFAQNEQGQFYGIYHQKGTNRLPQRMILKMTSQQEQKIYQIFQEGLTKRFEQAR
jgi:phage gpG-like protein